jgi:hypothetical protein
VWPRGFQEVRAPRFHDIRHAKVVRSSASRTGRLYPQEMFLVLIFTRGWVDPSATVRSEGDMSLNFSVTPPGIDPGTVRLVAQRLKHYASPGPCNKLIHSVIVQERLQVKQFTCRKNKILQKFHLIREGWISWCNRNWVWNNQMCVFNLLTEA